MNIRARRGPFLPLLAAALLIAGLALLLCGLGRTAEPVLLSDPGDPAETAAAFFDCLCGGRYDEAAAYCRGGFPAEQLPEDEGAARLYELVRDNRRWERAGDFTRRGIHAAGTVRFTYLDVTALTADMKEDVNALLSRYVEEATYAEDVYNSDESYREEVVLRAWDEALDARLAQAERHLTTIELPVELVYEEQRWQVESSDALLRALAGGV